MDFKKCIDSHSVILMEGALGERLKREYMLCINDDIALANLIYDQKGRTAIETLWKGYMSISQKYQLSFLATTPTRRANKERVLRAGYDEKIILDNIRFLDNIRNSSHVEMYIGGLMGCRGNAYTGANALSIENAYDFHCWQTQLFKRGKVDFLYAGIMPVLTEATGIARAMSDTDIPYIISFTIQRDGKLIDGHTIDYAIRYIDDNVNIKPIFYMTNCVHPDIVYEAISHKFNQTENVRTRFIGIQANTSALSYSELDGPKELYSSSPFEIAEAMLKLKLECNFKIFGGCCGTDNTHMEEIAKVISDEK